MAKEEKTNVCRILDKLNADYTLYTYDPSLTEGILIADALEEPRERVFKTLVTVSGTGVNFVFVIPVEMTLDLKKAARTVGMKSISMIKQKELLPLTGYIHGGCSPLGMKKHFETVIDISAQSYEKIYVSAGKVGFQIKISPEQLISAAQAKYADITVDLPNMH